MTTKRGAKNKELLVRCLDYLIADIGRGDHFLRSCRYEIIVWQQMHQNADDDDDKNISDTEDILSALA